MSSTMSKEELLFAVALLAIIRMANITEYMDPESWIDVQRGHIANYLLLNYYSTNSESSIIDKKLTVDAFSDAIVVLQRIRDIMSEQIVGAD